MPIVKSVLTGLAAAILALVVWVLGQLAIALIRVAIVASRSGAGGLGAVSVALSEVSLVVVPLAGFAAGFYWMWRRSARKVAS